MALADGTVCMLRPAQLRSSGMTEAVFRAQAMAIAAGELRKALTAEGMAMSDKEAEKLLKKADLNGDGQINGADLSILLASWGSDDPIADINRDGTVGARQPFDERIHARSERTGLLRHGRAVVDHEQDVGVVGKRGLLVPCLGEESIPVAAG